MRHGLAGIAWQAHGAKNGWQCLYVTMSGLMTEQHEQRAQHFALAMLVLAGAAAGCSGKREVCGASSQCARRVQGQEWNGMDAPSQDTCYSIQVDISSHENESALALAGVPAD